VFGRVQLVASSGDSCGDVGIVLLNVNQSNAPQGSGMPFTQQDNYGQFALMIPETLRVLSPTPQDVYMAITAVHNATTLSANVVIKGRRVR